MKFSEYMDIRGGKALTGVEVDVLGIEYTKGWRKRYADMEVSSEQINKLISKATRKVRISSKNKTRLQKFHKTFDISNTQMLYFMVSEGKCKIGISKDPIKRARVLTTSGGIPIELACVWDVTDIAVSVERHLHKVFKQYRLEGEWFTLGEFSYQDIEANIYCPFERKFLNKEAFVPIECSVTKPKDKTKTVLYNELKFETGKALLFDYFGQDLWIAKSTIMLHDKNTKSITVNSFVKIPEIKELPLANDINNN